MTVTKTKNKPVQYGQVNSVEILRESVNATKDIVKTQAAASVDDLWRQLMGGAQERISSNGEMSEGEEISFSVRQSYAPEKKAVTPDIAPGLDYRREILEGDKRISSETEQMLSRQIQEILQELRQIVMASKELEVEYKEIVIEHRIENPGAYHISFFQFMLSIVRNARQKIESSSTWLQTAKGRKQKQGYWNMFKKHGTTFGLSHERTLATQAG